MTLLLSIAIGVLFGTGIALMQGRDLIRTVAGVLLVSNAVNLLIISAGLSRGAAPIYPLPGGQPVSDPLVEALALTATVITFGLTSLLLVLVYRVYVAHASTDSRDIARRELEEEREPPSGTGRHAARDRVS